MAILSAAKLNKICINTNFLLTFLLTNNIFLIQPLHSIQFFGYQFPPKIDIKTPRNKRLNGNEAKGIPNPNLP